MFSYHAVNVVQIALRQYHTHISKTDIHLISNNCYTNTLNYFNNTTNNNTLNLNNNTKQSNRSFVSITLQTNKFQNSPFTQINYLFLLIVYPLR